jgi:predicted nucleic acid-binding protein
MRAVLGKRVRFLLANYAGRIDFLATQSVFDEARNRLPEVLHKRNLAHGHFIAYLDSLENVIRILKFQIYADLEATARRRLARRDEDDWPSLAAALALECPIWTEDTDFFGCGVATWTTDRIEMYMADESSENQES